MLGSSRLLHLESDPAGRMGPRDCAPLALQRPYRIARAMPDWRNPVISSYSVGSSPVQVAKFNPNRAILAFACKLVIAPNSGGAIGFGPDPKNLSNDVATFWLTAINQGVGSGAGNITAFLDREFSYENEGIKSASVWYARAAAGSNATTVCVTEWEYFG